MEKKADRGFRGVGECSGVDTSIFSHFFSPLLKNEKKMKKGRQRVLGVGECSGVDTSGFGRARSFHRSILDSFLMSAAPTSTNTLLAKSTASYSLSATGESSVAEC